MAKAPLPGAVKTRLVPPLRSDDAAALGASFLRDVTENVALAARDEAIHGYVAYAPSGSERAGQRHGFSAGYNDRTDSRRGASGRGGQIPDPRNVPAEEWDPSGLVRLALEFGCQLINNQHSPLGCD
jgi:hypothetical protein